MVLASGGIYTRAFKHILNPGEEDGIFTKIFGEFMGSTMDGHTETA